MIQGGRKGEEEEEEEEEKEELVGTQACWFARKGLGRRCLCCKVGLVVRGLYPAFL
jgi:hypothetical protein